MIVPAHKASVTMFRILDEAYNNTKSEKLLQFPSEANPFLSRTAGSAGPAVFHEFEGDFPKNANETAALRFARDYLAEQGRVLDYFNKQNEQLLDAFNAVATEESWNKALE
jgi:hypothetical protein